MVDIIDEVNEDLRRERLNRFWQRAGGYVIGVSLAIIIATVAVVSWKNYTANRQAEASEAFLAADKALKSGDFSGAIRQFGELGSQNAQGIPALARLKQAHAYTRNGQQDKAMEAYLALADDREADAALRSMARIYAAQIMADQPEATLQSITEVLRPVSGDTDNPFSVIAREQLAYASLHHGDEATGRRILAELASDMEVPLSLRRRAQAQVSGLGGAGAATEEETPVADEPAAEAPAEDAAAE